MDYKYVPFNLSGSFLSGRYYWSDKGREIQDLERMMELCPDNVEYIRQFVMDECDRQEYEGSLMYDEYPDKLGMRLLVSKIRQDVMENGKYHDIYGGKDIDDIILLVLICEMHKRRSRRKKYYGTSLPL